MVLVLKDFKHVLKASLFPSFVLHLFGWGSGCCPRLLPESTKLGASEC